MNQNLRANKTNFHMKGFAHGLALKQRRKATQKLSIGSWRDLYFDMQGRFYIFIGSETMT